MKKLAINILHFDPQNVSSMVLAVAAAVWLIVWMVLLVDIAGRSRPWFWKLIWIFTVTIPVLGGIFYPIYELVCSEWASAFHWKKHETKSKKRR